MARGKQHKPNDGAERQSVPGSEQSKVGSPEGDVSMGAPWDSEVVCTRIGGAVGKVVENAGAAHASEASALFIKERTRLHETYIREVEKTKSLSIVVVAICMLAACAVLLFAPDGREHFAYGVAAALFVFATGVVGFRFIKAGNALGNLELDANTHSSAATASKKR